MPTQRISVDQRGASAGGKLIGRDDNSVVNITIGSSERIRELVQCLDREIAQDQLRDHWIESLEFFEEPHSPDGIIGLEAKLIRSDRADRLILALRHKELFVKFLSRYSLYGSAQELLALCLHRVHQEFEAHVHPMCDELSSAAIDQMIADKVIGPVVQEYGFGSFSLNHGLVMGMVYWLAERCYVRWHA